MSTGLRDLLAALAVRRKVFISYHHDQDQAYYTAISQLLTEIYDCVSDNSLERRVDSDDPEYVMRRIRENHITGTSCTIVLCGADTPWRKYVDWEIKATLDKAHGLVAVRLPTAPIRDGLVLVPDRLHDNISSGYTAWISWSDLHSGAAHVKGLIETAVAASATLIDNHRPMRARNG